MPDSWLEVRSCNSWNAKELEREAMLRRPALVEAMKVAENAAGDMQRSQYWEYSVKLNDDEIDELAGLFAGTSTKDDGRSIQRVVNVTYNGKCYALTLFAFKE